MPDERQEDDGGGTGGGGTGGGGTSEERGWFSKFLLSLGKEGAKALAPALVAGLFDRGNQRTSNESTQQQMDLSRALMQMQQQQFGVDLPFRKALFNRIKQRQQRQRPRIMPGRAPVSNPYRNVRRVNPFQLGKPESGANQSGGKYQIPLSMLLQGRMPQTSNAMKNNAQQFAGIAPPKARPQPSSNPPN